MHANQRRDQIIRLLREDGSAKVTDLARLFKVSEVTMGQDLEKLDKKELIGKKTAELIENGGAIRMQGWFNGHTITRFKVPHFVATLTMLWTGGFPITGLGDQMAYTGTGWLLGIPMPVWISAAGGIIVTSRLDSA